MRGCEGAKNDLIWQGQTQNVKIMQENCYNANFLCIKLIFEKNLPK